METVIVAAGDVAAEAGAFALVALAVATAHLWRDPVYRARRARRRLCDARARHARAMAAIAPRSAR